MIMKKGSGAGGQWVQTTPFWSRLSRVMWCSLTRVATVLALLYLSYNIYVVYTIFNPPSCTPGQEKGCLVPAYDKGQKLQVQGRQHKKLLFHIFYVYVRSSGCMSPQLNQVSQVRQSFCTTMTVFWELIGSRRKPATEFPINAHSIMAWV